MQNQDNSETRIRIGVDVGGTFTDVAAIDGNGHLFYLKTPSTPKDQSIGVVIGLHEMFQATSSTPEAVNRLIHGATVATNALLERKGANVALLTTKGFRDILHIGRQTRSDLYDLKASRPVPLVARRNRYEVSERTRHTGKIEKGIDEKEIQSIVERLVETDIDSIAICYLHSYINPENEQITAQIIQSLLPDIPISVSSQILPEFREYERMSTTVLNAYVQPVMAGYLNNLRNRVLESCVKAPIQVMQSNGGTMSVGMAADRSVHTLLSGPAGGVLSASHCASLKGYANCITADVGGTSFDVSTIINGDPSIYSEGTVEGYPLRIPHIDIHTIGAGGGSIAWIDKGGALRVGPHSAGAVPGPVCYGLGGTQPSVTDAHAVLGRLPLEGLLGGALKLDFEKARKAINHKISDHIGVSVERAAEGILRVVNSAMTRAIGVMTIERGLDPRRFILIAFGGAGPLHAIDLARQLKMSRILIPVAPGNFSAFGLLVAPVRYDSVQTYQVLCEKINFEMLNRFYRGLEKEVFRQLDEEGFSYEKSSFFRQADLRYYGQAYELSVDVPGSEISEDIWRGVVESYHQSHRKNYGFAKNDPVELVNLRVSGVAEFEPVELPKYHLTGPPTKKIEPRSVQKAFFEGKFIDTPVYDRNELRPGDELVGPAIIQENGSTTVLYERDTALIDQFLNIEISVAVD